MEIIKLENIKKIYKISDIKVAAIDDISGLLDKPTDGEYYFYGKKSQISTKTNLHI